MENSMSNKDTKIPDIKRDGRLMNRMLIITIGGFDAVLDKESRLYLRLLCRLIDKSFNEYYIAKEYMEEEIKIEDRLAYRFAIIDHLENCINAINRVVKVFNDIDDRSKQYNLFKFVSKATVGKIRKYKVSNVRNRVEHIDEDIYENKFHSTLFLDVDSQYEKISINDKYLALSDITSMTEDYHSFVLEIFKNLPNRCENGIYYYDKK